MSTPSTTLPLPRRTRPLASLLSIVSIRFSLRELFLVMTTCAAVAAWAHGVYEKRKPFAPTHIAEYFSSGLEKDIAAARAAIGEQGAAWSQGLPFAMYHGHGYEDMNQLVRVNRDWGCDLQLPRDKSFQFREELIRRIKANIRHGQVGEHISEFEYLGGGQVDSPDYYAEGIYYHVRDIHGTLRIYLVRTDDKHARLIAALNEWRDTDFR
jgi:hypothetical protein